MFGLEQEKIARGRNYIIVRATDGENDAVPSHLIEHVASFFNMSFSKRYDPIKDLRERHSASTSLEEKQQLEFMLRQRLIS